MNLSLTADQITVVDGVAYVVTEAEVELVAGQFGVDPLGIKREVRPPAWMTEACETCDGDGWVADDPSRPDDGEHQCPECLNGKPIHTFDVEIWHDGLENAWVAGQRRPDLDHTGPESSRHRTVTYRLAVREYEYDRDEFMAICEVIP